MEKYDIIEQLAVLHHKGTLTQDEFEYAKRRIMNKKYKNKTIALLLSIFFGIYGVDRFYLGDYFFGIFKILLAVLFAIFSSYVTFSSISKTYSDILSVTITGILAISIVTFWIIDIVKIANGTIKSNSSLNKNDFSSNKILSILDEIEKASELYLKGTLNLHEFNKQKNVLIDKL